MPTEPATPLPTASVGALVAQDYLATGLSLKAHPVSLLEPYFSADSWQPCSVAIDSMDGRKRQVIGLVTGRQRPGTAKGTVFASVVLLEARVVVNPSAPPTPPPDPVTTLKQQSFMVAAVFCVQPVGAVP